MLPPASFELAFVWSSDDSDHGCLRQGAKQLEDNTIWSPQASHGPAGQALQSIPAQGGTLGVVLLCETECEKSHSTKPCDAQSTDTMRIVRRRLHAAGPSSRCPSDRLSLDEELEV